MTDEEEYQWQTTGYDRPAEEDLVVYELLLRDFSEEQTFQALIDTINYLAELGINAIELMPVNEFEGNLSWGYNPAFYFAVDKYYGPKDKLKELIDLCHQQGIAVIIDMVLNHSFGSSPMVRLYWDAANNRPAANSPWFNQIPKHPYNVGFDFNHESAATQYFVDRVNTFWLEEFKVDGFRFDLSKGFTQFNSGNDVGLWGQYDQSRIDLLTRMADVIWDTDSTAYVILEHFANNDEETVLSNLGMMLWGNHNYNYNEATMGYHDSNKSNFSGMSYINKGWNDPHLIGYMESHDEERLMYKNMQYGNSSGGYNIKELNTALERMEMAGAFFFTIPGPKMIWEFGELGYDYSINWPSGTPDDRLTPKPPRWDYYEVVERRKLYDTWKAIIALKKNYEAFRTDDFSLSVGGAMKKIQLNGDSMHVTIIGNFDVVAGDINPFFQDTGTWYDYLSGDSITVTNSGAPITLQPGEFHIYTDVKLPKPNIVTGLHEVEDQGVIESYDLEQNYPNPFNPSTIIRFAIKEKGPVSLKVYDVTGSEVAVLINDDLDAGVYEAPFHTNLLPGGLASGIYLYRLETEHFTDSKKMMLLK
jgi:glycosidase